MKSVLRNNIKFLIVVLMFGVSTSLHSQDSPMKLNIKFIKDEMNIDGKLDEPVYNNIEPLVMKNSITGKEIENEAYFTAVQVFYDKKYFYMSFTCFDRHIHTSYTKRDEHLWKDEAVEAFIDVDGTTPNSYVEIQLSPANVWFDSYITDPKNIDIIETPKYDLNGVLKGVQVVGSLNDPTDKDLKWTSEIAIPLKQLSETFDPETDEWKINFYRINRDEEPLKLIALSPPGTSFHRPEYFISIRFD